MIYISKYCILVVSVRSTGSRSIALNESYLAYPGDCKI
jgi:hypothetical protein